MAFPFFIKFQGFHIIHVWIVGFLRQYLYQKKSTQTSNGRLWSVEMSIFSVSIACL